MASPYEADFVPSFSLSVFADEDGVSLQTHIPQNPDIRRYANQGLLYGLAILTLDREGVIEATMERLEAAGPINEVDAHNRITSLLLEDADVLSV
jgi:hypothetical protein